MLVSDCATVEEFEEKCGSFFTGCLEENKMFDREELFFHEEERYDAVTDAEKTLIEEYSAGTSGFLTAPRRNAKPSGSPAAGRAFGLCPVRARHGLKAGNEGL
jgi:hypothetical protein